jgi:hypothetical protein
VEGNEQMGLFDAQAQQIYPQIVANLLKQYKKAKSIKIKVEIMHTFEILAPMMNQTFENYFGDILPNICSSIDEGSNDLVLYSL